MSKKLQGLEKKLKLSEETISLVLGLGVVLLVGGLLLNFFQGRARKGEVGEQAAAEEAIKAEEEKIAEMEAGEYVVQKGDSLWKIADTKLANPYAWVEVAKLNNFSSPDLIEVGQKISLPAKTEVVSELPKTGRDLIEAGSSHRGVEGDSLSKIALQAYGDMFAWVKIFQANRDKLQDPNLLEIGMELSVPQLK